MFKITASKNNKNYRYFFLVLDHLGWGLFLDQKKALIPNLAQNGEVSI